MRLPHRSARSFQEGIHQVPHKYSVDLESVCIDDRIFSKGESIESYEPYLGLPNRCNLPPLRAPYGHRNNVAYLFDEHGLVLTEHHATYLIQAIYFIFEPADSRYRTQNFFSGDLSVLNTPIRAGMRFEEFGSQCGRNFTSHLGHAWFLDSEGISIQFEVKKSKGKRGLEKGVIQYLCVGFRGAHKTG